MHRDSLKKSKTRVVNLDVRKPKFSIADLPDHEIWNEFKKGNEGAFNHIYQTYFQKLYQYGQQFTRDFSLIRDLVQDLFIDIRRNRKNLGEAPSIKFYLFKAFRRNILKYNKKFKIIYSDNIESFNNFKVEISHEERIMQSQLDSQKKKVLEEAFLKLSKRKKEAIYYYFYQSMSYKEVAVIMGLSNIKSARNLIYKSIDGLKAQINPIRIKLLTLFFSL